MLPNYSNLIELNSGILVLLGSFIKAFCFVFVPELPLKFNIPMKPLGEIIRGSGMRSHQSAADTQVYSSVPAELRATVAILNRRPEELLVSGEAAQGLWSQSVLERIAPPPEERAGL